MITSSDVHTHHNRQCRLRLAQYHMEMLISNILRDKSFVDDLNKEQGIVSMRVGSALRSTEIKPLFPDLWRTHTPTFWLLYVVRQLKSPLPCGLYRVRGNSPLDAAWVLCDHNYVMQACFGPHVLLVV